MEEHQIVVRQFERMTELARQMESIPALVLQASYSYQSFGSWWLEFKKAGLRYRLVYDGRDRTITLDLGGRVSGGELPSWRRVTARQVAADSALDEAIGLIRDAAPSQGSAA